MYKYFLSECLLIKDENRYLIEHITRDLEAGIEHFFIYDNCSSVSVENFLSAEAPELLSFCTIIHYDCEAKAFDKNIQIQCYKKYLSEYGHLSKWSSITDTDEIYTGNLRALCEQCDKNEVMSITIDCTTHGFNGHIHDSEGTLFERFGDDVVDYTQPKTVSRTEFIKLQLVHKVSLTDPNMKSLTIPRNDDCIVLHHFLYKSFEEFCEKKRRGSMWCSFRYSLQMFTFNQNNMTFEQKRECREMYKNFCASCESIPLVGGVKLKA